MASRKRPIKVVMDTNVLISALLWEGIPHHCLELIESGTLKCYATVEILSELEGVLSRKKFEKRISEL